MAKIWYSSKELSLLEGLPSTIQGVNRRARAEKWQSRKRSGVQGKAAEYHIDSLPDYVKMDLVTIDLLLTSSSLLPAEPLRLWVSIFTSLTNEEQEYFTTWLIRNGVKELTRLIQQQEQNFSPDE